MGERADAGVEGFHVALHDEVPTEFLGIAVAELYHLAELPLRVDVHEGERHLAGGKCLFGQTHHDAAVLADAIEHYGVLELGGYLADDVYALGFKFLEVGEVESPSPLPLPYMEGSGMYLTAGLIAHKYIVLIIIKLLIVMLS